MVQRISQYHVTRNKLMEYDLVVLVTDHDTFDYDLIHKSAKCIVGTLGRYRHNKTVVKA